MTDRMKIPAKADSAELVLKTLESYRGEDIDWRAGKTWSLVYHVSDAHHDLLKKAHQTFFAENGLNPVAFKSLKRIESEVVQMGASMLNAPATACGTMTSGGTESLLMAVKSARDRARKKWPWIRKPNMVLPATAHVAFDKGGHYFDVELRHAPIDSRGQVDVAAMRKLINRNTILIAASAPQYPHGTVDPIAEIGKLAQEKGLPFHVDACFGGFMLPWLERIGVAMPVWDFRVPGVTSMSADLHKYGYASKGASIIIYRDMSYLRHQFFVVTGWAGGVYVSPSMPGTRAGGPIAAAWASLRSLGEEGYIELARQSWAVTERLRAGVEAIPELRLMGLPHSTVVTWGTSDPKVVDVYAVCDILQAKGWGVDRQQAPACVHLTVNANNAGQVDAYLADLKAAVAEVKAHPERAREGEAAMYGLMAKVPLKGFVKEAVLDVMEQMYGPDGGNPDLLNPPKKGGLGGAIDRAAPKVIEWLERAGLVSN
jgi:sphinganine-1-phosphate aldolase